MSTIRSAITAASLAVAAGAVVLAGATSASATGTAPPWAPGGVSQDPNAIGGITFFDSSGNVITHGSSSTAPSFAYGVGLQTLRSGDTTATMFGYVPQVGVAPDSWHNNEALGGSPSYPNAGAPDPIKSTTLPTYTSGTGSNADISLDTFASDYPQTATTAGYVNTYELRIYTSGKGRATTVKYDYADITIDPSTHTWNLVYTPDAPSGTATTSTLGASTTTPNNGDTVHLTDTVAANSGTATPTGTVQFQDGSTNIGSPVTLTGGVAKIDWTANSPGSHPITAVYTPSGLSGFTGSTSNTVTVVVPKAPASDTQTALAINPTSGPAFSAVTLTATPTIKSSGATAPAGTVKFYDGGTQIGATQNYSGSGSASITYSGFAQGDHPNITATYTPTDTSTYNASTSPAVDFNATAPVGATPDPQPITADVGNGSLAITTPYTKDHPLNLGTMQLNAQGTELKASAQFGDGTYKTYGSGGPDGTGSIQIVDTRSGGADWTASASSADLTDATGDTINSQNVGLTALHAVVVPGNALTASSLTFTDNPASDPAKAAGAAGTAGLGGGVPHKFANTTGGGDGTIGIYGTLTLTAPTSTKAGHYTGIITFTVA